MRQPPTILFVASFYKGTALIEEARALGCQSLLLAREQLCHERWPPLDAVRYHPDLDQGEDILRVVTELAGDWPIGFIFPLDEGDVERAARLREHFCLPGPGQTLAHNFRDKLTMRLRARRANLCVPDFVHLVNHSEIETFTRKVAPDWVLKPRSRAGCRGIQRISSRQQLSEVLHHLGDQRSHYLLEQWVAGEVFHLDSIVFKGRPQFVQAHHYGTPPFEVMHCGGVFSTRSLGPEHPDLADLLALNHKVIECLELAQGVTHAEFIRCRHSGRLYFLEIAARVGGANIDVLVEKTTGINLWREWIRVELAAAQHHDYKVPRRRHRYGGMLTCLAGVEHPDLSPCAAPEVQWKLDKAYHAGMVIVSDQQSTTDERMDRYQEWLRERFLAVLPAKA